MMLVGFTREQIIQARDTCGVPGLYLIADAWKGKTTGDGLVDQSTRKTPIFRTCLRVHKIPDGLNRRGNPKFKPNPFARQRSIHRAWQGAAGAVGPYVNWDGHFAFMARLFALNPDGRIESSRYAPTVYRSEADFYFQCTKSRDVLVAQSNRWLPGTRNVTFGEL